MKEINSVVYSEKEPSKECLWLHYVNDKLTLEAFGNTGWVSVQESELSKIGNLEDLATEAKSSLVEAINEVAESSAPVDLPFASALLDTDYGGDLYHPTFQVSLSSNPSAIILITQGGVNEKVGYRYNVSPEQKESIDASLREWLIENIFGEEVEFELESLCYYTTYKFNTIEDFFVLVWLQIEEEGSTEGTFFVLRKPNN